MKEKKKSDLAVLLGYAGSYKGLTFLGLGLSAVAMVLGMLPYICIWLVARDLIAVAPDWTEAAGIAKYGWMAFGFAVAGIAVYFAALMCTHLAAFRTASNIRKAGMKHLMKTPLGFFDSNASGFFETVWTEQPPKRRPCLHTTWQTSLELWPCLLPCWY